MFCDADSDSQSCVTEQVRVGRHRAPRLAPVQPVV
eukprot:COSAG01_NODE_58210_length_307_cov_1.100962_1_plen_34_part_10